jgi:hypothetical protein
MYQSSLNRSRNDKYLLIIDIPKALKNKYDTGFNSKFLADPLQITIYGSPVPDVKIPDIDIPYSGQVYKTSSLNRPAYTPLNVKFLIDNSYYNYWLIWNWLNLFNDYKEGGTDLTQITNIPLLNDEIPNLTSPMTDFTSRFSIFGLDEYNNKIISFTYTDVFPTSLSEINFSNREADEITCNVTFSFNQLHVDMLIDSNSRNCS